MAFSNIVEDSRRMNAKMIAMGQSVDIQKMPRPKPGSGSSRQAAMYTPSGSDVEKLLYPRNFKPRAFELEEKPVNNTEVLNNSTKDMLDEIKDLEEQTTSTEETTPQKPKMIGDDEMISTPRSRQKLDDRHGNIIRGVVNSSGGGSFAPATWLNCRYKKEQGDRIFCTEFHCFCMKEKCKVAKR